MKISQKTMVSLREFVVAVEGFEPVKVTADVRQHLTQARKTVDALVAGEVPIYGLNTGLGANLNHRLKDDEVAEFQQQILLGRACGTGDPLPEITSKAAVLARIFGAAKGYSGMSVDVFDALTEFYNAGLVPVIPRYGSIGAGDLVLNAHMVLPLIGKGEIWLEGKIVDAASAMATTDLTLAELKPKDAMALINHSCISAAAAGLAINEARQCLSAAKYAAALSFEGYGGNRSIFAPELQTLRVSKGQAETAKWFQDILVSSQTQLRKIQDALCFRVLAPVFGTAHYALSEAIEIIEAELNGVSDSPVVLSHDNAMHSTANFHNPMLVHAVEALSRALVQCARSMVQRVQKLMSPNLSDLPKYLSAIGGVSAGMVPLQKTANSLLAEIINSAQPVMFSVPPVSEGVEDMTTLSMVCIGNLESLLQPFHLLTGVEALVASQAMDLRDSPGFAVSTQALHETIRAVVPMLTQDRILGPEIKKCADVLKAEAQADLA